MSSPHQSESDLQLKDIVIVGAGPTGLSLACALADTGLSIAVVDQQKEDAIANPAFDGRDIAMTHLSKNILQTLNVWSKFNPEDIHPLREATVQDGDSPYALHFERTDDSDAPLGYLVANHQIRKALYEQVCTLSNVELLLEQSVTAVKSDVADAEVTLQDGQRINTQLVVAADSRFSNVRRMMGIGAKMTDYGRVMIVCNMRHESDHRQTAQECFRYGRTCAILPLSPGESSIVITVPATRASALLDLEAEEFATEVEQMLDHRLGRMSLISERYPYPLVGAYSNRFTGQRFALAGDAAVGMHPVTAHGYNLGLRSADTLATQIRKALTQGQDIGNQRVLRQYEARHQILARPLYDSTNLIVRLYTDDKPVARIVRKAAIRIGNNLPPFKKLVAHRLTQMRMS